MLGIPYVIRRQHFACERVLAVEHYPVAYALLPRIIVIMLHFDSESAVRSRRRGNTMRALRRVTRSLRRVHAHFRPQIEFHWIWELKIRDRALLSWVCVFAMECNR